MKKTFFFALLALVACRRADDAPLDTTATVTPGDSVVAAGPSPSPADTLTGKACGVSGTPLLEEDGVGELKQGRAVSEVARLCEIISDSEQRGTEGMMERVVVVRVAGEPVRTIVTNDRIFRIEVTTPRFRTSDSLGVDTPLSRIASMRGAQFAPGEDGVYGFSPEHCGLSFRFSVPWRPPSGSQWTAQQINAEHGNAAVNRVIVIPCRR